MSNKTTLFNASPSNFNILLIRIFVFILSAFSFSQGSSKIKGSVVDIQTNNGLAGANVFIEGTAIGDASDVDGKFLITNVEQGTYNLKAMFLGYKSNTVTIQGLKNESANKGRFKTAIETFSNIREIKIYKAERSFANRFQKYTSYVFIN